MAQESGGLFRVRMATAQSRLFVAVIIISWLCVITGATKCYKNEDIGEEEANIYYCNGDKSECCEENQEFTCCEPASKKTLEDQLILWGGVIGVALVIAIACCYFWRDCNCLREDTRFSRSCCCCRKKVDEHPLNNGDDPSPSKLSNWPPAPSFSGSRGFDRDTPVDDGDTPPPFFYKSPSYGRY